MPQLMDPSEPEDSKDEHEPASIYTPGEDAYISTFGSAAPRTILCNSGATISYMRSTETLGLASIDYIPISLDKLIGCGFAAMLSHSGRVMRGPDGRMVGEVPWKANRVDRIEHKPGKANVKAERQTLDRQTRQIAPQNARELEKGSEAEARLYSVLHDYPVIDKLWADCVSSAVVPLEADLD
jgi:hypothetical protein